MLQLSNQLIESLEKLEVVAEARTLLIRIMEAAQRFGRNRCEVDANG